MIKTFALLHRAALLVALSASLVQTCAAQALTDLLGRLTASAKSSGDATLKSLAGDLSTKATALNTSLKGSPPAQNQLQSGVQSLVSGSGAGSLDAFSKLAAAKLTPDQVKLAKEVGNLGSAYLVQKNLGALEGSQGDVATIVKSLRKGEITPAVPAIGRVAQNAKLSPAQKDLVGSLADKYAPGAKKIGSAIEGGLKSIPGLGK